MGKIRDTFSDLFLFSRGSRAQGVTKNNKDTFWLILTPTPHLAKITVKNEQTPTPLLLVHAKHHRHVHKFAPTFKKGDTKNI